MAIIPGYGGQKFLPSTIERLKRLEEIKKEIPLLALERKEKYMNENEM